MAARAAGKRGASKRSGREENPGARAVYIHGIAQSRRAGDLKFDWDAALFGGAQGLETRMAYWADLTNPSLGTPGPHTLAAVPTPVRTLDDLVEPVLAALPPRAQAEASDYVRKLAQRLAPSETPRKKGAARTRLLPPPFRRPATALLTRLFLRDTAAYFYDPALREAMRDRLRSLLRELKDRSPLVLVAHSQGSIIAYDVLHELGGVLAQPLTLVTIGSPLGLAEVQDHIRRPLAVPAAVGRWLNFADRLDPVALDAKLASDFRPGRSIADEEVTNTDRSGNPHSATGYLATLEVREAVHGALRTRFLGMSRSIVSRDVAYRSTESDERQAVLIELRDDGTVEDRQVSPELIAKRATKLETELRELVDDADAAKIDRLRYYVAAELLPHELDELSVRAKTLHIQRVWKNATKRALIHDSARTIHVDAARNAYAARGTGIGWAVLDTGIARGHRHFREHKNIVASWDCTEIGEPKTAGPKDRDGHGTHVAGIIAGEGTFEGKRLTGIAPEAKLHVYKVLRDDANGEDSLIIKALDHIATLNDSHSRMVIHGVNLSLGYPFDPEVYACGHSPICRELRRLWRQGVLVCVAAGNEGQLDLIGPDEESEDGLMDVSVNVDLSIGDPANLEECIAVGSVHKTQPHTYGVSYFSSKGPTADGRAKPDVVAPGERIVSANGAFERDDDYVELSGTSMACPHVSGMLAAFLSVRREFIGQPDAVKKRLLASCIDLGRDRYVQGAGLPNLLRMLTEA